MSKHQWPSLLKDWCCFSVWLTRFFTVTPTRLAFVFLQAHFTAFPLPFPLDQSIFFCHLPLSYLPTQRGPPLSRRPLSKGWGGRPRPRVWRYWHRLKCPGDSYSILGLKIWKECICLLAYGIWSYVWILNDYNVKALSQSDSLQIF